MKKIKNLLNKLCYGAFYARKTHPSNPPDNHDFDTLIQTEAIFIGTEMVSIASIIFTLIVLVPNFLRYAPFLSILMIIIAIVIPMFLFRDSKFIKVIKTWEAKSIEEQISAKKMWRTFFWSTWAIALVLTTIAALLHIIVL